MPCAGAPRFAIGLDFGTNSARALVVELRSGHEVGTAVARYPSGTEGVITDPSDVHLARQSPADYAVALQRCVRAALRQARRMRGFEPDRVIGIGVATTGSTPLPVDETCTPLGLRPAWRRNPHAQAWLWKDHTSHAEAEEITAALHRQQQAHLPLCGGRYSSEWFWSKILHCRRVAPRVSAAAASWLELCDYIPALLTGCCDVAAVRRSLCAAGHKALYHPQHGLPRVEFWRRLDPGIGRLRARLYARAYPADTAAGGLSGEWAHRLGLSAGTPVAVGAIDAHLGAVGAGIRPGVLVKILGTSACDLMVTPRTGSLPDIPGLCGAADGSVIPGMWGLEAGQPAVGDLFNWWAAEVDRRPDAHARLTQDAAQLRPGEAGLLALDWNNGNRCVLVDARLTGLLVGQTLHTTPAEVYRALIEATAFGARVIIERFEEYGVRVREVVTCGGIAEKNSLLLQIYADVTGRPIHVSRAAQTCALGAAICGAVAAGRARGGFRDVAAAQRIMCGTKAAVYRPQRSARRVYARLFKLYRQLHDAFGGQARGCDVGGVMKALLAERDRVRVGG